MVIRYCPSGQGFYAEGSKHEVLGEIDLMVSFDEARGIAKHLLRTGIATAVWIEWDYEGEARHEEWIKHPFAKHPIAVAGG